MGQMEDIVDASRVLTIDEISALAHNGGKPAETLMNVCALIARRARVDVCCVYLLEPDRINLVLAASLGLRPQCIGTLRMATHEGLVGLVAERLLPARDSPAVFLLETGGGLRYFLLPPFTQKPSIVGMWMPALAP